jgi:rubredoxin
MQEKQPMACPMCRSPMDVAYEWQLRGEPWREWRCPSCGCGKIEAARTNSQLPADCPPIP